MTGFIEIVNNEIFDYLPGGIIGPAAGLGIGFLFGAVNYIRSYKYLYYYYIEHGIVICFMDNYRHRIGDIITKYKLDKDFRPVGYVSGLTLMFLWSTLGTVAGSIWPVAVIIGILTIPNFILRRIAREKRNKAIFEQTLKGTK